MKKQFFVELSAFAYILLFSYAAASKLFDMNKFEVQMKLQPFNDALVPFLMWAIPISLITIVLLLLVPRYRITGLKLATVLMTIFTFYIFLATLGYFKDPPCTCAGVIGDLTWGQHLWFNMAFWVLGLLAVLLPVNEKRFTLN